jgi:hypothetical protein
VLSENTENVSGWMERAMTDLDLSLARDGWFGPAHAAYNDVVSEFRSRLAALFIRARAIE